MTKEEKQPQCLYGRTYKERLRSCEYCSVACPARIPDFDTEVYNWLREHGSDETRQLIEMTARHFSSWRYQKDRYEFAKLKGKEWNEGFSWGYDKGRSDEKQELMKDAVEYEVYDFSSNEPHPHISVDTPGHITGDKVKVIIVMEDEK